MALEPKPCEDCNNIHILNCDTDSVTICSGEEPISIEIANAAIVSDPIQIITGAASVILIDNVFRRSFTVQNTGTAVVTITFGSIDPTATVYHFALSPGSVDDDGKGTFYTDDQWTGEVRAFSSSPSSVVVMEII